MLGTGNRRGNPPTQQQAFLACAAGDSLRCLPTADVEFTNLDSVQQALQNFGPIMVGGRFGESLRHRIRGQGRYIVVAGTDDTNNNEILVFDPWHSQLHWMAQNWVSQNEWYDDDSQIVCV